MLVGFKNHFLLTSLVFSFKTNLSFQKFIHKEPDSTVIAEFKPNASDLDLMLLRNKIANTIASMKDSERDQLNRGSDGSQNQCFIEVTKVSRAKGMDSSVETAD